MQVLQILMTTRDWLKHKHNPSARLTQSIANKMLTKTVVTNAPNACSSLFNGRRLKLAEPLRPLMWCDYAKSLYSLWQMANLQNISGGNFSLICLFSTKVLRLTSPPKSYHCDSFFRNLTKTFICLYPGSWFSSHYQHLPTAYSNWSNRYSLFCYKNDILLPNIISYH